MFIYKYTETIEYVKNNLLFKKNTKIAYFVRKIQTLRVKNSRIGTIKNWKFSGC